MKLRLGLSLLLSCSAPLMAQTALPSPAEPQDAGPVPYASVSQVNLLLSQLDQTSQAIQRDLSGLRIEKWKTDSNTKRGSQADVASIQRNLQTALPEIIAELRNSPDSLSPTFRLYRNLNALYDVFTSLAESTGAFGSRDDYQLLQNDVNSIENSRRMFADRMEALSGSKEAELSRLRSDLQNARASTEKAAPPKKVVVDDTEPPKKPIRKKPAPKVPKPPAGTAPAPDQTTPPPAATPVPQ
jgi:hypothetical protein